MKELYRSWSSNKRVGWGAAILWMVIGAVSALATDMPDNHDTVIWISMDGMRADYLDRAPLPFFHRMLSEGAFTRRSRPTFPSITFPSHSSQATGVGVDQHGISGNSFYDSANRQRYTYPADANVLQAEPIWLTATRQGVRALVFDWPLSQHENGVVHAAYFEEKFEQAHTDEERLSFLLEAWRKDQAEAHDLSSPADHGPLRLLMGYIEGTDPVGHKYGPDAPEISAEMVNVDRELGAFQEQALAQWKSNGGTGHLYFLFTTDHGMSKVDKVVDLEKLMGLPHSQHEIDLAFTGNTASVFFDGFTDAAAATAKQDELLTKLRALPFAQTFRRSELPAEWHYAHPTRVGDLVVVLAKGYTFGKLQPEPVMDTEKVGGPKGMHGYPIADDPEMYGPLIIWRYPDSFWGKDLGEVDWSQIHPTVAKLLGIEPSAAAHGRPIDLP